MRFKIWIVSLLEKLCNVFRHVGGCKFAEWSDQLDQHWESGVWKTYIPEPEPPLSPITGHEFWVRDHEIPDGWKLDN